MKKDYKDYCLNSNGELSQNMIDSYLNQLKKSNTRSNFRVVTGIVFLISYIIFTIWALQNDRNVLGIFVSFGIIVAIYIEHRIRASNSMDFSKYDDADYDEN